MLKVKVERMNEDAIIPHFAHPTDSGFDLYTCEDTQVKGKEKVILKTGLKFEIPEGWGIQIKNKSGITIKGCPAFIGYTSPRQDNVKEIKADVTVFEGTVDMNYRGEIGIMVKNESDHYIKIPKHTKIAQGVLRQVFQCEFEEVDKVDTNTDRGEGGYGSTGDKH